MLHSNVYLLSPVDKIFLSNFSRVTMRAKGECQRIFVCYSNAMNSKCGYNFHVGLLSVTNPTKAEFPARVDACRNYLGAVYVHGLYLLWWIICVCKHCKLLWSDILRLTQLQSRDTIVGMLWNILMTIECLCQVNDCLWTYVKLYTIVLNWCLFRQNHLKWT